MGRTKKRRAYTGWRQYNNYSGVIQSFGSRVMANTVISVYLTGV